MSRGLAATCRWRSQVARCPTNVSPKWEEPGPGPAPRREVAAVAEPGAQGKSRTRSSDLLFVVLGRADGLHAFRLFWHVSAGALWARGKWDLSRPRLRTQASNEPHLPRRWGACIHCRFRPAAVLRGRPHAKPSTASSVWSHCRSWFARSSLNLFEITLSRANDVVSNPEFLTSA